MPKGTSIHDDSGAPCRVLRRHTDTGPMGRIWRRLLTSAVPFIIALGVAVPFVFIGLSIVMVGVRRSARGPDDVDLGGVLLPSLAALLVFALVAWFVVRAWTASISLDLFCARRGRDRCGVCGFDLAGLAIDSTGLRSCPECGHRWGPPPPRLLEQARREDARRTPTR